MNRTLDRPTLTEQYALASVTSDLGLPRGPETGTGAQGILAAAAWTEVSLGSALRRLRSQWDSNHPARKLPRPIQTLRAVGMTREEARQQHHRERMEFALSYHRAKTDLKHRIPEYRQAADLLMTQAVRLGFDEPDAVALAVLNQWLEDPTQPAHGDAQQARLGQYLCDCLSRARAALVQGMAGHTKHELSR
jgi:hypothetical protein